MEVLSMLALAEKFLNSLGPKCLKYASRGRTSKTQAQEGHL